MAQAQHLNYIHIAADLYGESPDVHVVIETPAFRRRVCDFWIPRQALTRKGEMGQIREVPMDVVRWRAERDFHLTFGQASTSVL